MSYNPSTSNIFTLFEPKPDRKHSPPEEVYGRGHRPATSQPELAQKSGASAPVPIPQPRRK